MDIEPATTSWPPAPETPRTITRPELVGYAPVSSRYVAIQRMAWATTILLILYAVASMLGGATKSDAVSLLALAYVIALGITGVLYLGWLVNALKQTSILSGQPTWVSGAVAVLEYFIPIICLYRPYNTMKSLWQENGLSVDGGTARRRDMVGNWWALWVFFSVLGNLERFHVQEPIGGLQVTMILQCVIAIPMTNAFLTVVKLLSERQEAIYGELTGAGPDEP